MMQGTKLRLRASLLKWICIAYSLGITVLLLFPATVAPKIDVPSFDKIGHLVVFILLVILWSLFLSAKNGPSNFKIIKVLLGAFIYGIVIEALQGLFIASRTADGWDLLANTIGILLGWIIFHQIKKVFVLKS